MLIKPMRSNLLRRSFPFILIGLFSLPISLFSQETQSRVAQGGKWQLGAQVNGVQFYYQLNECAGRKIVLLKFNNTNPGAVKISWNEEFLVDENNQTVRQASSEKKSLELAPGETDVPTCETAPQRGLLTRPSQKTPVYTAKVKGFSFTNVVVLK
jgi:hypothetical protein